MRRRILCLYLPQWPIQRALGERKRTEEGDEVLVLQERDPRRGDVVAAASTGAMRAGVRVGIPLAEAEALVSRVTPGCAAICLHDRAADLAELARLAERCERFSPIVGWETVEGPKSKIQSPSKSGPSALDFGPATGPDCLFLDVTGIGVLFDGEDRLAQALLQEMNGLGYEARAAVASSIGAAWAGASQLAGVRSQESEGRGAEKSAAQYSALSTQYLVLSTEYSVSNTPEADPETAPLPSLPLPTPHSVLRTLAPTALRLPPETIDLLTQLGIQQISDLLALPRESLRARFGERLLLRIDQLLGTAQETIVAYRPPPQFFEEWVLEYPAEGREVIELLVEELVRRLARALAERREGVVRLICRLDCAPGQPLFLQVGLFHPSADAGHLGELVRMQLERAALDGAVGRVRLEAVQTAKLENRQGLLFAGDEHQAAGQFAQLIDRCNSRLGARAVLQPELTADPLPEKAVRYRGIRASVPNTQYSVRSTRSRRTPARTPRSALRVPHLPALRPLTVYSPPIPLNAISIAPDGPPMSFVLGGRQHQIVHQALPERIETGWWRGKSVRRDYWRVETATGERFWLFRHLDSGRWNLHGAYA